MATRLETLQSRLEAYLAAEARILQHGQESAVSGGADGRMTKRGNLAEIRTAIKNLETDIATETAKVGRRSRSVSMTPNW